jgi:hypothetical protein
MTSFLCPSLTESVKQYKKYVFDIADPQLELHIFSDPTTQNLNLYYIKNTIVSILTWIRAMRFSIYKPTQWWKLSLWTSPAPLKWCADEKVIGVCNVNSGETEFTDNSIEVRIIRLESLGRTLIHELLHAHLWDRIIQPPFFLKNESEGFIESVSRILYSQWVYSNFSRVLNPKSKPMTWQDVFGVEMQHTQNLASFLQQHPWTAKTHVTQYYYFPAVVFQQWQLFWDTLKKGSPHQVNSCWKSLLHSWPQKIKRVQGSSNSSSCASLAMVYHQLDLS